MYVALSKLILLQTTGIIANFFLAMVKHPKVLDKAQREIDNVIGNDRLPQFEDEATLPYVSALVKEVYRWRNITPQATPHRLNADDSYKGYHIPKDSIVIGNTYALLHDPVAFPEPDVFRPERYLDPATRSPDPIFGYGGRLCPGRFLAKATTWLTIANLLATFHIESALDENGNLIQPDDVSYTDGVVWLVVFSSFLLYLSQASTHTPISLAASLYLSSARSHHAQTTFAQ